LDFLDIHAIKVSKRFYLSDALYLRRWKIHAVPHSRKVLNNIFEIGIVIDMIEDILGEKIIINSWYRPDVYNRLIGGARYSVHRYGGALDFKGTKSSPDEIRKKLKPFLLEIGIRMENLPGSSWVHVDIKKPKKNRFFKP